MDFIIWLSAIGVAFLVTVVAIRYLAMMADRLGLMDRPGGRKRHARPVPVVGGAGVMCGLAAAVAMLGPNLAAYWPIALGLVLLALVGVADDALHLGSSPKFVFQIIAAALAVGYGGALVETLGAFPDGRPLVLGALAVPFSMLAIVGFINALNMLDGVDGLAGGAALVMLGGLAVAASLNGGGASLALATLAIAAVMAFLVFNVRTPWQPRARVFLGDGGSLPLGLLVAWLAIEISQSPGGVLSPMALAWILVVPVLDTVFVMLRRLLQGRSPFVGDRIHLHHILLRAGLRPGQVAVVLVGLIALLAAIGVNAALMGVSDTLLFTGLLAVALVHGAAIWFPGRVIRVLRRGLRLSAQGDGSARLPERGPGQSSGYASSGGRGRLS